MTEQVRIDYTPADLGLIYQSGMVNSWDDMLSWLRNNGSVIPEITQEKMIQMIRDLQMLKREGVPFSMDPQQVYQMILKRIG